MCRCFRRSFAPPMSVTYSESADGAFGPSVKKRSTATLSASAAAVSAVLPACSHAAIAATFSGGMPESRRDSTSWVAQGCLASICSDTSSTVAPSPTSASACSSEHPSCASSDRSTGGVCGQAPPSTRRSHSLRSLGSHGCFPSIAAATDSGRVDSRYAFAVPKRPWRASSTMPAALQCTRCSERHRMAKPRMPPSSAGSLLRMAECRSSTRMSSSPSAAMATLRRFVVDRSSSHRAASTSEATSTSNTPLESRIAASAVSAQRPRDASSVAARSAGPGTTCSVSKASRPRHDTVAPSFSHTSPLCARSKRLPGSAGGEAPASSGFSASGSSSCSPKTSRATRDRTSATVEPAGTGIMTSSKPGTETTTSMHTPDIFLYFASES
eukprot:Rhum_TRINITY_DN14305_c15_g1::Rhum_TRINITY_DN14305_c15_g1_i1::g.80254::m.80254